MEEKLNSDTERTSIPYPEYIVTMAAVINQYARGEISVYECFAFIDEWGDAHKETFERDGGLKALYWCTCIEDKLTRIIQHSEENDRKAHEYLLQRHPDPEWWKNR